MGDYYYYWFLNFFLNKWTPSRSRITFWHHTASVTRKLSQILNPKLLPQPVISLQHLGRASCVRYYNFSNSLMEQMCVCIIYRPHIYLYCNSTYNNRFWPLEGNGSQLCFWPLGDCKSITSSFSPVMVSTKSCAKYCLWLFSWYILHTSLWLTLSVFLCSASSIHSIFRAVAKNNHMQWVVRVNQNKKY